MLIRISGGSEGIKQYLVHGMKSGRTLGRDQLDDRVVLVGDLDMTDQVISSMKNRGDKYYHVTLSFFEDSLSEDALRNIAAEFAGFAGAAYSPNELCFYAEAHLPRIKSYGAKSGEIVFRRPHIHLVVPKTNLLTGKVVDLFGNVKHNIDYIDAFQEYVNAKYGLVSPKERRRLSFDDESTILERTKHDDFSGPSRALKQSILDAMLSTNLTDEAGFKVLLESFGKIRQRNAGRQDAYWNVLPKGAAKGVNLKEFPFSNEFIRMSPQRKEEFLHRDRMMREAPVLETQGAVRKPSGNNIDKLQKWRKLRCREIKLVGRNAKLRAQYKDLKTIQQKMDFLDRVDIECTAALNTELKELKNVERAGFFGHDDGAAAAHAGRRGQPWWGDQKRGARGPATLGAAPALHRMRGLSARDLDARSGRPEELLSLVAPGKLGQRGPGAAESVRRAPFPAQRRVGPATSLPGHYLRQAARRRDRERVRTYAKALERVCTGQDVQAALERAYGLPRVHLFSKSQDGSMRVLLGADFVGLDTFLADHMRLEWEQSLDVLRAAASMRAGHIRGSGPTRTAQLAEALGFTALPLEAPMGKVDGAEPQEALYAADDGQLAFEVGVRQVNVISLDRYAIGTALALAAHRFGEPLELSGSPEFLALAQDLARDMRLKATVVVVHDAATEEAHQAIELDDEFDGGRERPRGY